MASSNQDLPGAMRARDRLLQIAADEDLDHDAKLFAFCLTAYLIQRRLSGRKGKNWAQAVAEMMYQPDSAEMKILGPVRVCKRIIADDIPRYEIPYLAPHKIHCQSPKARGPQAGQPCGKGGSRQTFIDRDPETGEARWIAYCRNHSHPTLDQWRKDRTDAWLANGKPSPVANTGGVLARYFGANWTALYQWADPSRKPMPNGKPLTPPRPQFALIQGGGGGA
jgi:hypothetical protein